MDKWQELKAWIKGQAHECVEIAFEPGQVSTRSRWTERIDTYICVWQRMQELEAVEKREKEWKP